MLAHTIISINVVEMNSSKTKIELKIYVTKKQKKTNQTKINKKIQIHWNIITELYREKKRRKNIEKRKNIMAITINIMQSNDNNTLKITLIAY